MRKIDGMAIGRCWSDKRCRGKAFYWRRGTMMLREARCPRCGDPLLQTTWLVKYASRIDDATVLQQLRDYASRVYARKLDYLAAGQTEWAASLGTTLDEVRSRLRKLAERVNREQAARI